VQHDGGARADTSDSSTLRGSDLLGAAPCGQTFVLVTHDPEVGASCDRIIRMRDGLIVADGRVPEASLAAA